MGARLCLRNDPETKGIIERNNGYLETRFLPGRRFDDVADFNAQLTSWLVKANHRIHATTKVRPAEAAYEDRGGHAGVSAGAARGVLAVLDPAASGSLRAGRTPTTTRSTRALSAGASR